MIAAVTEVIKPMQPLTSSSSRRCVHSSSVIAKSVTARPKTMSQRPNSRAAPGRCIVLLILRSAW